MTRPALLVLRPLGLGDLLTGLPAMRALGAAFPGHRRLLAAPPALAPLALHSGAVDALLPTRPLEPLSAAAIGIDVAVDLHGRGPASQRVLVAARPRRLLAFANDEVPETAGLPAWRRDEHEVHRWCRMLAECGVPADPGRLELAPPAAPPPAVAVGAVLVHPGAASAARRWPEERWAAVARAQRQRGHRVVLTGGAGEVAAARRVARMAGLPDGAVLAGRTGLLTLAATVAAARMVLCGDTGVGHLATALGTPSVLLFGPTPPAWWGPPPDRTRHRVLWAGRCGDPHGAVCDPGLLRIGVEEVVAAAGALVGDAGPPRPHGLRPAAARRPAAAGVPRPLGSGAEPGGPPR
jgi:ADP-heptose:LPS heptosyltransferase